MKRAIALLGASLTIASLTGGTIAAADAGRGVALAMTGSDTMCALLPAREARDAARERMDVVTDVEDFCSYSGRGVGTPATVVLVQNPGASDSGELIDQARELRPDATEIQVAGVPALLEQPRPVPTRMREASIHLFPDAETWFEVSVILPRRVDIGAALQRLGEAVVSRYQAAAAPSPSPVPSPAIASLCEILTADEVTTAYAGIPVTVVADQPQNCVYSGEEGGDAATGLVTTLALGAPESGTNLDTAKATYPDAVELDVAGVPALLVADSVPDDGVASGTLHVFADATTWLLLDGAVTGDLDMQAALTTVGELAVPRLVALLAVVPSPSPAPSLVAGDHLKSLFPTALAAGPIQIQEATLDSAGGFLSEAGAKAHDRVTRLLGDLGLEPDDAPFHIGSTPSRGAVLAVQVPGADIAPFVQPLLTLLGAAPVEAEVPDALAARGITAVELQGAPGLAYPRNDILWIVLSEGDEITEIFDLLP